MLVLSRKEGEQIVIGENIVITVVLIDGNKVRLGVTAPSNVPIRRDELPPGAGKIVPLRQKETTLPTRPRPVFKPKTVR